MGDKRLKAIVVRGTKAINIAGPAELEEICSRQYQEIQDNPHCGDVFSYENEYADPFHVNNFAWGNARKRIKNYWNKEVEEQWKAISDNVRTRWTGCFNCPKKCHQEIHYPGRQPYFQICFSKLTYAMAAYQGLRFNYDILHAARRIGKGAEAFDHNTIKKLEQVPLKLGKVNYPYFLMWATGEKMTITQIEGSYPQAPEPDKEERKRLVAGWDAAPERFKKWFMEWEPWQEPSVEESVNICDWNETMHYVDDAIGTCAFLSSFRGQIGCRPPYHIYNLPDFISLAAGINLDADGLWEIARRNRNLIRAINVRRGLRRIDEKPPEDHWKIREPEMEQKLLDAYYEFKGWNSEGIPTKETLDKLGLDYVSDDFLKRGILTDRETGEQKAI